MNEHIDNKKPLVLIYKRTHTGDPNEDGIFGINDCMGKVRNRNYDAVIGIGGKRPCAGDEEIAFKINWIGITPIKYKGTDRGSYVKFKKFYLYDEKGILLSEIAPNLYQYMYKDANRRVVMSSSLPLNIFDEVLKILSLAKEQPLHIKFAAKNKLRRQCKFKCEQRSMKLLSKIRNKNLACKAKYH